MKINLNYPAEIKFDGDVYHVNFIDIENCFTYGETLEEAFFNAQDGLGAMLKSLVKDNQILPNPSRAQKNVYLIAPFPEVAAPIELYILRKQKGKTLEEVARLLGISKQRYAEIENGKNLTLKSLRKASQALGACAIVSLATV